MSQRCVTPNAFVFLALGLLAGCASTRQIAVDYPKPEAVPLLPLKGQTAIGGDDYYLQLVSEFEFKGDNALKAGCSEVGGAYETGDQSAAVLFSHPDGAGLLQGPQARHL